MNNCFCWLEFQAVVSAGSSVLACRPCNVRDLALSICYYIYVMFVRSFLLPSSLKVSGNTSILTMHHFPSFSTSITNTATSAVENGSIFIFSQPECRKYLTLVFFPWYKYCIFRAKKILSFPRLLFSYYFLCISFHTVNENTSADVTVSQLHFFSV